MKSNSIISPTNEYVFEIENVSKAFHAKGENVFMALATIKEIQSTTKIISAHQITADNLRIDITEYLTTS